MEYLALFYTTSGAMRFKRNAQKLGCSSEAMPVPRSLSSGCGIAIRFDWVQDINIILDSGIQKLYRCEQNQYTLVHEGSNN